MRVTRAIREYVEAEIYKKYEGAKDQVGKEYFEEKDEVMNYIRNIALEASAKAKEYILSKGYTVKESWRNDKALFSFDGSFQKKEVEDEIFRKRNIIEENRRSKTKQVLFDLEMGDTEKAQLKNVLDSIVVEGE